MSSSIPDISPDGRWEIERRVERDFNFDSDAYCAERRWEIVLRNTATQKVFRYFSFREWEDSTGLDSSGVSSLEFAPDSAAVIAQYTDGNVETIALPPADAAERQARQH
jgi:hypothetical protein